MMCFKRKKTICESCVNLERIERWDLTKHLFCGQHGYVSKVLMCKEYRPKKDNNQSAGTKAGV